MLLKSLQFSGPVNKVLICAVKHAKESKKHDFLQKNMKQCFTYH